MPLVLMAAGNDAFGFDPPGLLDSPVYLGYFWHYPEHLWVFDDNSNYKISRLPWILPGYAAQALLGATAGTHVLVYLFLALSSVAVYLLVRDMLSDRLSAAAIGIAWACCTSAHGVGGWNYHVVPASAYYLLACWLVVRVAHGAPLVRTAALAGACFAAAVHTHLFLAAFAPLVVVLYRVALPVAADRPRTLQLVTGGLAGGLALTIVLAVINLATGGAWLFFMPQIEQALRLTEPAYDHWWRGNLDAWLPSARYLVLPVSFLIAGLAAASRPRAGAGRPVVGLVALGWSALAIMCVTQFVLRQTTLDYAYMAFPLYLHAFPCLGAALTAARRAERVPPGLALLVSVVVPGALLVMLPTRLPAVMDALAASAGLNGWPITGPLLVGVAGAAALPWLPVRARLVAFALWYASVNAWVTPMPRAYGIATGGYHRQMLQAFQDADRFTTALDPSLIGIKYWMSDEIVASRHGEIPLRGVFDSYVATRGWLTNLLGRRVPSPPPGELSIADLERGTCIGVLSSIAGHEPFRRAIEERYASLGRELRLVAARSFEGPDLTFALTVLKPAAAPASGDEAPCLLTRADGS